jgi:hypothetical protein
MEVVLGGGKTLKLIVGRNGLDLRLTLLKSQLSKDDCGEV